jgi:hypothetical protein
MDRNAAENFASRSMRRYRVPSREPSTVSVRFLAVGFLQYLILGAQALDDFLLLPVDQAPAATSNSPTCGRVKLLHPVGVGTGAS